MDIRNTKRVLYTVITDDYDHIFPPMMDQPGWDMICFTDNPDAQSGFWQVRPLPELPELSGLEHDPVRRARLVKILPHRFLQEYEYSVYIDANRVLDGDLDDYVEQFGGDVLCLKSLSADAYAAAEALLDRTAQEDPTVLAPVPPLDDEEKERLRAQMDAWKKARLPKDGGCPGTAVLGRRHGQKKVTAAMETWAAQVLEGCAADEVAFPAACHAHKLKWVESLSQRTAQGDIVSPAEKLALAVPHLKRMTVGRDMTIIAPEPNSPPPGGRYDGYPFLLTIGVPVSNQIGTIRRCLEGIQPILDALPSELVVVDTGSRDGTVEVCREFGARVVEFPWIDNMSAARNQAIQAAQGLWFMSIDDDEWFEDTSAIIRFFEKGDYRNHDLALYFQRNFQTDGLVGNDYPAIRLGRRDARLHFHGRIHDLLSNADVPDPRIMMLKAYANHFGFSFEQEAEKMAKSIRNLNILKLDMAQFPRESRHAMQMINELGISQQPVQAYRVSYYALSLGREVEEKEAVALSRIRIFVLMVLREAGTWRDLIRMYKTHVQETNYSMYARCVLTLVLATAYGNSKEFAKSNEYATLYLKYRKEFFALPAENQAKIRVELFTDPTKESVYLDMLKCLLRNNIELDKRSEAKALLCGEDLVKHFVDDKKYKDFIIANLCEKKDWALSFALLDVLVSQEATLAAEYLLSQINACARPGDLVAMQPWLPPVFERWPGFADLLHLRQAKPGDAGLETCYEGAVCFVRDILLDAGRELRLSLLGEALRLSLDPRPALSLMDMEATEYLAEKLQHPIQRILPVYKALESWQAGPDVGTTKESEYLAMRMLEIVLSSAKRGRGEERYMELFKTFVQRRLAWSESLYLPDLLGGYGNAWVDLRTQAVCASREVLANLESNDYLEALRALRVTAKKAPELNDAVDVIKDQIMALYEEEDKRQQERQDEFATLLKSVKPKIEQLIASGMRQEVLAMLAQLEKLAPNDPDLPKLKQQASLLPPS